MWPTTLVVGPNRKPILKISNENIQNKLEAFLFAALEHFSGTLNSQDLPIVYEKDK